MGEIKIKGIFVFFLILILHCQIEAKIPSDFMLILTDSKTIGTKDNVLHVRKGENVTSHCSFRDDLLFINNDAYEYATIASDVIAVISKSGGVRYIIDFNRKTFCHGQVNLFLEDQVLITKTSVGEVVY